MKNPINEKEDLIRQIERLSSYDELQRVKAFIAKLEASQRAQGPECEKVS